MRCIYLALMVLTSATSLHAQQLDSPAFYHDQRKPTQYPSFVFDKYKPFVWIEFDHTGPQNSKGQSRMWLRLHNNCTQPIDVTVNGTPEGALADERNVQFMSIDDPPMFGFSSVGSPMDNFHALGSGSQLKSAAEPTNPHYFPPDVGSAYTIYPNSSVLFSAPSDAIGPSWHLEVAMKFVGTTGPSLKAWFGRSDLP